MIIHSGYLKHGAASRGHQVSIGHLLFHTSVPTPRQCYTPSRDCLCVQAFAFVEIFAAAELCGCNISQFIELDAVENIFVTASASAYAETCISAIPFPHTSLCWPTSVS